MIGVASVLVGYSGDVYLMGQPSVYAWVAAGMGALIVCWRGQ